MIRWVQGAALLVLGWLFVRGERILARLGTWP